MATKYRKNTEIIEAVQFKGEMNKELSELLRDADYGYSCKTITPDIVDDLVVETPEGNVKVFVGDYIIKGVNGEYYPCKPDIFEKTYEKVD